MLDLMLMKKIKQNKINNVNHEILVHFEFIIF